MKNLSSLVRFGVALVSLLAPIYSVAQPGVPNITNPKETEFQHETHFLTFIGSFVPETADSSRAYYKAIDPNNTKPTFADWLKNAGFINDVSQWNPYGPQKFACNLPGCDYPAGTYGPGIINTDSHVIVVNAADLGFVRNQFIRCVPSCTAKNPKIYTYLENYPVAPFAAGGSNFGNGGSAFPLQSEADAAIASAITRPLGQLGGDGVSPCTDPSKCIERIADVAFEWAPPALKPTSTSFGQLYAYIFAHRSNDPVAGPVTVETTDFPAVLVASGLKILDFTQKTTNLNDFIPVVQGDKFAPNLDGFGFKQHPGVCLVCHGGKPATVSSSTAPYPNGGNINGFRFLPLDIRNLMFEDYGNLFSVENQQAQIKAYNLAVLLTVPTFVESDGTGAKRVAHLREVIQGWYAADGSKYSNDTSMSASTQNGDFVPKGWREAPNGTAPAGSESLYKNVVGPSCRSCHFNRELSLDFGTATNFHQESDLQQLALLAACKQNNPDPPDPKARFMPLAHITFQRFWQPQATVITLPDGTVLTKTVDQLAAAFGYGSVAGYCATNP